MWVRLDPRAVPPKVERVEDLQRPALQARPPCPVEDLGPARLSTMRVLTPHRDIPVRHHEGRPGPAPMIRTSTSESTWRGSHDGGWGKRGGEGEVVRLEGGKCKEETGGRGCKKKKIYSDSLYARM
jgi:hypothetical protein